MVADACARGAGSGGRTDGRTGLSLNNEVPGRLLRDRWPVARRSLALAERALERGSLSTCGFDRLLRVGSGLAEHCTAMRH